MCFPFQNRLERCPEAFPFGQHLLEYGFSVARDLVETLVALVFLTPLAHQQTLGLKPAQERVQRAFINLHAVLGEGFAQRVSVLLSAELSQHRDYQASAAQFQPQTFNDAVVIGELTHTVRHILYITQYKLSREVCRVFRGKRKGRREAGLLWRKKSRCYFLGAIAS